MANVQKLNDNDLDQINGGLMDFNGDVLTYTSPETGVVTTYTILNYDEAWKMSNDMHAQNYREDTIIKKLKQNGYIA